jgi:hypothetical protein
MSPPSSGLKSKEAVSKALVFIPAGLPEHRSVLRIGRERDLPICRYGKQNSLVSYLRLSRPWR